MLQGVFIFLPFTLSTLPFLMIIGLGETVLDIIFKNNQPVKAVPGGSTFNAMISVGRTGSPCVMATETGDDHIADIVTDFLKENGVQTDYVFRHEGTQSHVSLAFLNERNDAEYQFYKNHAALTMDNKMPEVNAGDIVMFGSYFAISPQLRDYVSLFLHKAKAAGAILYYDINFRASHKKDLPHVMQNIEENMRLATILRGSAEDFEILYGTKTCDETYKKYIADLCPNFIYTNADKPVELRTPSFSAAFPAKPITPVSTIGAGDNFNAGFCYALNRKGFSNASQIASMSDADWKELIQTGQAFSSEACLTFDNYVSKEFADSFQNK